MRTPSPNRLTARVLTAPGCSYCPQVVATLTRLQQAGELDELEIIDVSEHPDAGAEYGVRSVPYTRLGDIGVHGVQTDAQWRAWFAKARSSSVDAAYLLHLLDNDGLTQATELIREEPERAGLLLELLASLKTPMGVRIGAGAILEEFTGATWMARLVPGLMSLAAAKEPQTRADAAYYLGLTRAAEARAPLRQLAADTDPEVREIAADALDSLDQP